MLGASLVTGLRPGPKSRICNRKVGRISKLRVSLTASPPKYENPSFATFSFPWIKRRKRSGGEKGERKDGEKGTGLNVLPASSHVTGSFTACCHTSRDSALGFGYTALENYKTLIMRPATDCHLLPLRISNPPRQVIVDIYTLGTL